MLILLIIVALIGFIVIRFFFKTSKFILKIFIVAVIFAFVFYFVNTYLFTCDGRWMLIDNEVTCNKPIEDGGKECSDSRECKGLCILEDDVGYCQRYEILKGCFTVFNETEKVEVCIE